MKEQRFSLAKIRSKAFCLGATLTMAALAALSVPAFSDNGIAQARSRGGRWIEVDRYGQTLTAWEGGRPVRTFVVSTGKRSTPTRSGTYSVQSKYRSTYMQGRGYYVPDVPYAMFYSGGYAMHGAYWHNRFGTPVSHGCVNLRVSQARWLYNWAPVGTKVVVR